MTRGDRTREPMRQRFGLVVFLALYGSVLALSHFYMALRLVLVPQVPSPFSELLLATFAAGAILLFARPLADRVLPERVVRVLSWPAFVWMGIGFLLLMCQLASDVVLSLAIRAAWALQEPQVVAAVSDRAEAVAVAASASALSILALWLGLRPPPLRRLRLVLDRWPAALDGFRIVQLSDVHIGPLLGRRFSRHLVDRVNAISPDLVAITGDLVDGSVEHIGADLEPMRDFHAAHGVFFVTGNHDYFSRADPWIARVRELGIRVLRNERVTISSGGGAFDLAGVDDRFARFYGGDHGENLERALEGRVEGRPVVLLAHNPNVFDEAAERGVDLQLSGHTHGGQIFPFAALVRIATRYVVGLYSRGESTLYVSRGTGFWGPPMRLFRPGEITELTLTAPPLDPAVVPGLS